MEDLNVDERRTDLNVIRDLTPKDEQAWRQLWGAYNDFYREGLPEAVTRSTWRRIIDPGAPVFARGAERTGALIGFSVSVLHEGTWTIDPICHLEDLFVAPEARCCGAGRALLDDLVARAKERGWSQLYWHTAASNSAARRLYEQFVAADDFVRYRVFIER